PRRYAAENAPAVPPAARGYRTAAKASRLHFLLTAAAGGISLTCQRVRLTPEAPCRVRKRRATSYMVELNRWAVGGRQRGGAIALARGSEGWHPPGHDPPTERIESPTGRRRSSGSVQQRSIRRARIRLALPSVRGARRIDLSSLCG